MSITHNLYDFKETPKSTQRKNDSIHKQFNEFCESSKVFQENTLKKKERTRGNERRPKKKESGTARRADKKL